MENVNKRLERLGLQAADILIPRKDVDLTKWAVVACDQFTSEKDYWHDVESQIGDAPSTLSLSSLSAILMTVMTKPGSMP